MIDKKKNLRNNTIALMIIQILNYVLPFITLPYVARIFTVEKFGLIFYAQVLMDYFFRFMMFGFDLSAVKELATAKCKQKRNEIFSRVVNIQILFLLIGAVVLIILVNCVDKFKNDYLIYYLSYLALIGQMLLFVWFYQGVEQMKFITILNIITRTLFLIFIFIFIKQPNDYLLYPLFNSVSYIIAGIISLFVIKKYFKIKYIQPKLTELWSTIKYSSEFFWAKIGISLYRQSNAFVLGLVTTTTMVAYYTAADKIFCAMYGLYVTFVNALFPYMTKNKDIVLLKKILKYLIFIIAITTVFMLICSKYLIIIFFGEKYFESIKILQIFGVSFSFYVFVDTLGYPLLGAYGYTRETNFAYIIGGIYNIMGLLILYLLSKITLLNIAFLVSSTYVIMFIHRLYYVNKFKLLKKEIY